MYPVTQDGREMIMLRDGEGIVEEALLVSKETAYIISLMDGTRSILDIQSEFMRASGQLIYTEKIQELAQALDSHLFLKSDKYHKHYRTLRQTYEQLTVRPPFLAGKSYPANRMELLAFLDEMLSIRHDGHEIKGEITGILAPHIDYARGMEVYKKTYPFFKHVDKTLIVILGTCHHPTDHIISISLKDFETPLETIPHANGLDRLILDNKILKPFVDEWPHRNEHSIELQLPLIQFMIQHDFEILPILTGSMYEYIVGAQEHNDGIIDEIIANLKDILGKYGKPFIVLAGADLAHIGAQFGDPFPLDVALLAHSKSQDEILMESIERVDAESFFRNIKNEQDKRRICGLTPIYLQLRLLSGNTCDITGYGQWEDGRSSVSFAGGVFYKK